MNRIKTGALFILAALLCTAAVSCGTDSTSPSDTSAADTASSSADTETAADTEPAYVYPELDCGGEDFNILNTNTTWGFYTNVYFEESTGETLDDTVFNANLAVEEAFNVHLNITEYDIGEAVGAYSKVILSGDDVYQTALTTAAQMSSLLLENYVMDLSQFPELRLNREWWDSDVSVYSSLGGSDKVYFGVSDINLMSFEVIMGIYVNDDILTSLDIPLLYDTVREGKWTFEKMHDCMKLAANLNGDGSFTFDQNGNAVYGLTYWESTTPALLFGAGARYIGIDGDGIPYLAAESEQFYNVASKISELFKAEGEAIFLNKTTNGEHYEDAFEAGRTLFTCAQLKASSKFRDMEDTYGILPLPKYDEAQDTYYGYCTANVVASTIPVTNTNPSRAAAIIDAMAYHAHTDVLPVYYGVNVEQKQMRNEDSIEMLEIMGANRVIDVGRLYNWSKDLDTAVYQKLSKGDASIASVIAAKKDAVQKMIDETLEIFEE